MYRYFTFIHEISVIVTSWNCIIEAFSFATALIGRTYAQYHRLNAIFYSDNVVNPSSERCGSLCNQIWICQHDDFHDYKELELSVNKQKSLCTNTIQVVYH